MGSYSTGLQSMRVTVSLIAAPVIVRPNSTVRQMVSATRLVVSNMGPGCEGIRRQNLHPHIQGPLHLVSYVITGESTSRTLDREEPS